MRPPPVLLLDTHVWIWWIEQDGRLPSRLRDLIQNHDGIAAVSAATIYETILLAQRGRIELNKETNVWIQRATRDAGIDILPIDGAIAQTAGGLPIHHGDPLDRLIIATAMHHQAQVVSLDTRFPDYHALRGRLIQGDG